MRTNVRAMVLGLIGSVASAALPHAQVPPTPAPPAQAAQPKMSNVNIEAIGPRVGSTVPDFTLPDQDGTPRRLRSLFGPRGMMLFFIRSADW
jgi:hypothetical protein